MSMQPYDYHDAFSRNKGVISKSTQKILRRVVVGIPGCGGIGSTVAVTLARLGIQHFKVADADEFGVGNFNRQLGANMSTVGVNKAQATKESILEINPEATVEVFTSFIDDSNVQTFVSGTDFIVDGIDFFHIDDRRKLFSEAKAQNVVAMTTAPLGFSGSQHIFLPDSETTFDKHFAISDQMNYEEKILRFLVALAPDALHSQYMSLEGADLANGRGPSSILGTLQASVMTGSAILKAVEAHEKRVPLMEAFGKNPRVIQADAHRGLISKSNLSSPLTKADLSVKRFLLRRYLKKNGLWSEIQKKGSLIEHNNNFKAAFG